ADQQQKEGKTRVAHPTKKRALTQKGPAFPAAARATFERLGDSQVDGPNPQRGTSQLQEPIEEIRRQLDAAVAAKRKAEAERDEREKQVRGLQDIISHTSRELREHQTHSDLCVAAAGPSFTEPSSNAAGDHGIHPPTSPQFATGPHERVLSCVPVTDDDATSECIEETGVDRATPQLNTLQFQEQNEQLHRPLDDEAAAKRMAEGERDGLKEGLMEVRDSSHKSGEPLECQTHPVVEADPSSSVVEPSSSASRVNMLETEVEELRYSSHKPRLSVAEAGPSSSIAEPSSPPLNPGEFHGVDPPRHYNSQWDHTKAASRPSPDADEATSEHLRDSQVHGANIPGGALQRQQQTEEIRRWLDDEATARQKTEAKVDRLEKELQEFRDIISLTSREPLERSSTSRCVVYGGRSLCIDCWLVNASTPTFLKRTMSIIWIEEYGPVITLTNGEDIHVIIGQHRQAVLPRERWEAVLVDRPYLIVSNEIPSRGLKFMQMSTYDRFRTYRKAAHSELQMEATLISDNDQTQYARNVVLDVLKEPESHQGHIKRFSAAMTLPVIYGKTTPTYLNDSYTPHIQRMYTFLTYVPGYTWGLAKWANLEHEQFINNVRQTKMGLEDHIGPHSVARGLFSKPEMGMSEDEISYFCGSLTQVAISTILMAAAHFPDIQEIIQAPSWAAKTPPKI
ncbi:hypothetical protein BU15DRAFT_78604, partial [Melanogaster broomeanus]